LNSVDIFPWNDHFNTGLKTVDKQHKKLVEILNSLASHIAHNSNNKDLNAIFDELTDYTIYHFETEEAIWHQYLPNDPLDADHQAIHRQFVETVKKIKKDQNTRSLIELAEEALGFLTRWLASHILETDRFMAYLVFSLREGYNLEQSKKFAEKKMSGSTRLLIDIILSIYSTLSTNTLNLMRELKSHQKLDKKITTQERYRDLLLELSTDFINLPLHQIDKNIKNALEKTAHFVNADRAYIFDYNLELNIATNRYRWYNEKCIDKVQIVQNSSINNNSKYYKTHASGEYILIQSKSTFSSEALPKALFHEKIKSMITFPLFQEGKCTGFLGFDMSTKKHIFTTPEITILEHFTKLLGNVAEREYKESALSHERNFLKTLFQAIPDLVWVKNLQGIYISCNSRFEDYVNAKESDIIGKSDEILLGKSLAELYKISDFEVIRTNKAYSTEEKVFFANDGHEEILHTTKVPMHDKDGEIYAIMGVSRNITSMKVIQKKFEHLAHFDTLTNLPNRIHLSNKLHQAILDTQNNALSLAIFYLDLDGFKEINDLYGHSNGDILLKTISTRIQEILREDDTVSRLGGDEFVIVLHDLKNKEDCIPTLQRILNVISSPVISNNISMQVSASIGVTYFNQNDSIDADQLLRQADHAMYQAKVKGKNRFHIFDVEEDISVRSHNENLDAIENAINNDEFIMYYQPKVNMKTEKILGVESLIRWNHPQKGILSPGYFLPTIENHPLSVKLDTWVLVNVIKQIQKWKQSGHNIAVSININPMKLQETNFIENLLLLLKSYPEVQPNDFTFEILETSALEDMNHISYIMKECNKIGIDFSLDDFGTGYSSLSYLKNLPSKQLKIDQTFVRDMLDDTDDMAILEGVISLASAFRREVIAEGVESIEQGVMLLRLGCEQAQGYVIAKPMPQKELIQWIEEWEPYPEWQNIVAVSREELPMLYAMTEHKIWIKGIVEALKENKEITEELNHHQCNFGTWLYKQNFIGTSKENAFQKIEKLHKEIHNTVNIIIQENYNQSEEKIAFAIQDICKHRDKFLEEFTDLFFTS